MGVQDNDVNLTESEFSDSWTKESAVQTLTHSKRRLRHEEKATMFDSGEQSAVQLL